MSWLYLRNWLKFIFKNPLDYWRVIMKIDMAVCWPSIKITGLNRASLALITWNVVHLFWGKLLLLPIERSHEILNLLRAIIDHYVLIMLSTRNIFQSLPLLLTLRTCFLLLLFPVEVTKYYIKRCLRLRWWLYFHYRFYKIKYNLYTKL